MIPSDEQALIADFRAFCASKPADEVFKYVSLSECAFAQYLKSKGYQGVIKVSPFDWSVREDDSFDAVELGRGPVPEVIDLAVIMSHRTPEELETDFKSKFSNVVLWLDHLQAV